MRPRCDLNTVISTIHKRLSITRTFWPPRKLNLLVPVNASLALFHVKVGGLKVQGDCSAENDLCMRMLPVAVARMRQFASKSTSLHNGDAEGM